MTWSDFRFLTSSVSPWNGSPVFHNKA